MRKGAYPGKRDSSTDPFADHRVIVPIYVPEVRGYFAEAPALLDLTLESLRRSTEGRASVTLISNGCAPEIQRRLRQEQEKGWLDQLVVNRVNRGKVDALRSALSGSFEPLLTVSDGDVLFHQGWIEGVQEVFDNFPEAASVSPSPNPKTAWSLNATTVVDSFLKRELAYRQVVPKKDLDRFASSLEHPQFFQPEHYRSQLTARRGNATACIGNGHFCVTLRRQCLAAVPKGPSLAALGQSSEITTIDLPPERIGGWKLATPRAWVRHLGNVPEPWMEQELEQLCPSHNACDNKRPNKEGSPPLLSPPSFRRPLIGHLHPKIRSGLARLVRKAVHQ